MAVVINMFLSLIRNDQRSFTRRTLREVLLGRSQESGKDDKSEKLKMDLNSIAKLVIKIEKNMFEKYGGTTKDYKNASQVLDVIEPC